MHAAPAQVITVYVPARTMAHSTRRRRCPRGVNGIQPLDLRDRWRILSCEQFLNLPRGRMGHCGNMLDEKVRWLAIQICFPGNGRIPRACGVYGRKLHRWLPTASVDEDSPGGGTQSRTERILRSRTVTLFPQDLFSCRDV